MVAFKKLPWVAVQPLDWAMGSLAKSTGWERDTTHCNSPGYQPSGAFAWKQGRQRYRYLGLTKMSANLPRASSS